MKQMQIIFYPVFRIILYEPHNPGLPINCISSSYIFVAPSMQDNLLNIILKSISCAVHIVTYDTGRIPVMIDHEKKKMAIFLIH